MSVLVSVVAPCFNEARNLPELVERTGADAIELLPSLAKALTGKPFSSPPETAVDRVSARSPLATVFRSAGRPTTTPIANRSAVVSVMITSMTMTIDTMAASSNVAIYLTPPDSTVPLVGVLALAAYMRRQLTAGQSIAE